MIATFKGKDRVFSNFGGPWLIWSEHLFQAMKGEDWDDILYVLSSPTPGIAKQRGREIKCRPDWEEIKLDVMYCVLQIKFRYGTENADALLATGDQELVEGNWWHDDFWGFDLKREVGANHLGRLLMMWRDELREMQEAVDKVQATC